MTPQFFGRLASWQMRHRPWVFLGLLVVSLFAGKLLTNLTFDFRPEALQQFSEEEQAFIEEFAERFNTQNNVLLVVLSGPGPGTALDARGLALQMRIAELAEATGFAQHVVALPRLPRKDSTATLLALATGRIPPLVEGLPVPADAVERVKKQVAGSRMLPGQLVAQDGSVAAVVLVLAPAYNDHTALDKPLRQFETDLAQLVTEESSDGGSDNHSDNHSDSASDSASNSNSNSDSANNGVAAYEVRFAGLPFVRVETVRNLKSEQRIFWPVTAVLYLTLLWFIYRDPVLTVLPLVAVGFASLWSLAVLPLTGTSVNVLNNIVPSLILVIGVCNAVHMLHGYRAARLAGLKGPAASRRMMEELGVPAFLTSLTTAIGFLSLMVARNESLQRLGWQAGAGVMLSYVALVLVLPTLVGWWNDRYDQDRYDQDRYDRAATTAARPAGMPWLDRVVTLMTVRPWVSLACATFVLAVSLWAGAQVKIDANVIDTFPPGHPIYESNKLVEEKLGGIQPLEIQLAATREEFFTDAEALRQVFKVQQAIAKHEPVLQIRSLVDLVAEVHGVVDDADIPALLTQQKVDYALDLLRRHQAGALSQFIDQDGTRIRLGARLRAAGIQTTLATISSIEAAAPTWLAEFDGAVTLRPTGNAYISARGLDYFIRDLSFSLITASAVIFLVLVVVFRSVRMGLLGVLPTIMPLALTLALVPVYGYQLNTSTAVVFTITIGMAVDNTIHILIRFRSLRRDGLGLEEAIRDTFRHAGAAVVASNLLLIAGFSILFVSDFEPIFRVAALTTTTIGAAMVAALLVLPELLLLFGGPIGRDPSHGS